MSIVSLQDIHKTYQSGKVAFEALRGVSLEIAPGDFAVLAGPSGSGKTTLLNIIGCLDRPTRGTVALAGKMLQDLGENELAKERNLNIGFVFQNFNLIPVLSALENVEMPLVIRKVSTAERRRRAEYWLTEMGLESFMAHRPGELSGGQQQRVAIARALVGDPRLVLADEPTANLDSATGESIIALMKELNRKKGVTFLLSTHDERIIRYASAIIHLLDGKVVV